GFLLSMLVSPASRASLVLGKILGSATLAWLQGMVILAFAPLAGFSLSIVRLAELSAAVFLVSFALAALGFLIAWKFDSTQGYHVVMNLVLLPMWLLAGTVFSSAGASRWMQWVMLLNPLTYATSLLRYLLWSPPSDMRLVDPDPMMFAWPVDLAVTALFGIAMLT